MPDKLSVQMIVHTAKRLLRRQIVTCTPYFFRHIMWMYLILLTLHDIKQTWTMFGLNGEMSEGLPLLRWARNTFMWIFLSSSKTPTFPCIDFTMEKECGKEKIYLKVWFWGGQKPCISAKSQKCSSCKLKSQKFR